MGRISAALEHTMARAKNILVAGLVILAVVAWLEWPAYDRYKESRSLRQAHAFLKTGDLHDAMLSLRQALALQSTNVEALTLMADVLGEANSRDALPFRQEVARLAPTTENKLLLAAAASRFEPPPFHVAAETLTELQPIAATNAQWHLISSQLALRRNDLGAAEEQLQAAAKLEPTNRQYQLNLAVIRLEAGGEKAVQARKDLSAMSADPVFRDTALRSLTTDSVNNKQFAEAKQHSDRLLALPEANFPDRLQQLTILNALGSADTPAWLARIKGEASTNITYALQTATWLLEHQPTKQTRDWLLSLPQNIRETFPMPLAVVDSYSRTKDWSDLNKWLLAQRWEAQDFLRFAWLSRAAREQNEGDMAVIYWHRAISAAQENADAANMLARLTTSWGWNAETEQCLRALVKLDPRQGWAWQALLQRRSAAGDTAGLLQLNSEVFEYATNSLVIKNNLASLELLLNQNTNQAFELAKEVYDASTNTAAFAATRAFALYRQNRAAAGLEVMQRLPQEQLSQPSIALYYALLLSANGKRESAAPYIAAAKNAQLLPEEQHLLEKISAAK